MSDGTSVCASDDGKRDKPMNSGGREKSDAEKGIDLVPSQPVVLTCPLALTLATGPAQAPSGLWDRPAFWAWVMALFLSLVIYGLDWIADRASWKQEEYVLRFVIFTFLDTVILGFAQATGLVKNLLTLGSPRKLARVHYSPRYDA